VRDLVVRESLRNLAEGASERFRELVRAGEEVPYEVREPGQGSPLATYAPLTERFIRERTAMIARLDAFGAAKAAIMNAGVARPYLEALGLEPVESDCRMAEDAIVAFLCRLWEGRSDFAYEPKRVDEAITELETTAEAEVDEVEVVVPVIGLRMTSARLELAGTTLVRADVVEAPPEVSAPEGSGRAGWEQQFLISTRCKLGDIEPAREDADGVEPAASPLTERIARVITAMRLFKPGGVALGPHAWIRTGGGRWRRIATGAGRPRPGAYRLAGAELGALAGLARALEKLHGERRGPVPAGIERAISRFEAGLGRDAVLEALNDHLLALRFLLEGDGPASTDMSWRVAALCAEPAERDGVRSTIERALALERELWSGDPALGYDGRTPLEVASEIEDFTRAILRDAACGHLGQDLRATADEILLADGLAAGEGSASQRGETSEWGMGEVPPEMTIERVEPDAGPELPGTETPGAEAPGIQPKEIRVEAVDPPIEAELAARQPSSPLDGAPAPEEYRGEQQKLDVDREAEPVAEAEAEFKSPNRAKDGWTPFVLEGGGEGGEAEPSTEQESEPAREKERDMEPERAYDDWFAQSGVRGGETLDFPKRGPAMRLLDQRPEERKRMNERVSTFFPDPETTDWSIGEIAVERRRRRAEH
jgi:hypothetical protein